MARTEEKLLPTNLEKPTIVAMTPAVGLPSALVGLFARCLHKPQTAVDASDESICGSAEEVLCAAYADDRSRRITFEVTGVLPGCRRLAKIMRKLGWSAVKARGLTPGGFKDQVRGYARDADGRSML
jgi:hypothetical protein